jgi:hypothetical protein
MVQPNPPSNGIGRVVQIVAVETETSFETKKSRAPKPVGNTVGSDKSLLAMETAYASWHGNLETILAGVTATLI